MKLAIVVLAAVLAACSSPAREALDDQADRGWLERCGVEGWERYVVGEDIEVVVTGLPPRVGSTTLPDPSHVSPSIAVVALTRASVRWDVDGTIHAAVAAGDEAGLRACVLIEALDPDGVTSRELVGNE